MEPKTPRGPRVLEEAEDMEQDLNSSQHAPSSEVVPSSSIPEPSQAQQGSPRDYKKDKVEREAEFIRVQALLPKILYLLPPPPNKNLWLCCLTLFLGLYYEF